MLKQVTQYSVPTYDRPGALGKITGILAEKGCNIAGIFTQSLGDTAYVTFIADNDTGIAQTLKAQGYQLFETPAFCIHLANKPGALADMARTLGENNINIWHVYGTTDGTTNAKLVISLNNPEKAKAVLQKIAEKVAA